MLLKKSCIGISDSRRQGARLRNRANPVSNHFRCRIKAYFENLFTEFSMICQSSVREPVFQFILINQINDAAAIERPEPEMSHQNGYD